METNRGWIVLESFSGLFSAFRKEGWWKEGGKEVDNSSSTILSWPTTSCFALSFLDAFAASGDLQVACLSPATRRERIITWWK